VALALGRVVAWWSALPSLAGLAWGPASPLVVRFLFGVGEAGMFPATARAFGRWLPRGEQGRAFGLALMTAALGGALSQPLVVALLARTSWRVAFGVFGSVGLVWAIGWWRWFRDEPGEHPAVNPTELGLIMAGRGEIFHHESVPWGTWCGTRRCAPSASCTRRPSTAGTSTSPGYRPTCSGRAASTSPKWAGSPRCPCSRSPVASSWAAGPPTCWLTGSARAGEGDSPDSPASPSRPRRPLPPS